MCMHTSSHPFISHVWQCYSNDDMKPIYPCVMSLTYVWWSLTRMSDVSFFTYVRLMTLYLCMNLWRSYRICTIRVHMYVWDLSDDPFTYMWWPFTYVCTYVFDDLLPTNGDPLPICNVPLLSCDPHYIHVVWHPLHVLCEISISKLCRD